MNNEKEFTQGGYCGNRIVETGKTVQIPLLKGEIIVPLCRGGTINELKTLAVQLREIAHRTIA